MDWKIHYGDGSTFCSEDGPVAEAPGVGAVCVTFADSQCGRVVLSGCDFFVYLRGDWLPCDWFGLLDHLVVAADVERGCVKAGRQITSAEFRAIRQKAVEDPDFPRKSAWRRNERPEMVPNGSSRD